MKVKFIYHGKGTGEVLQAIGRSAFNCIVKFDGEKQPPQNKVLIGELKDQTIVQYIPKTEGVNNGAGKNKISRKGNIHGKPKSANK